MIRLEDTSGGAVASAIAAERHRMGSSTTGMVLTMLILSDEERQADATAAAVHAARQHPMRIVTLIPRPAERVTRLDAEIAVGGDDGPGEVAVLRLRGALAEHANSVAIPLLLSDTPVVAYWPGPAPLIPAEDPIGRHAQRRITDVANSADPVASLLERQGSYRPGDTDLSWTRITPWRSALAGALDTAFPAPTALVVEAETRNASAVLLASWLHQRLHVEVDLVDSAGQGITGVAIETKDGPIRIHREHEPSAVLARPGEPESAISIPRRDLSALLAEELRLLDPDEAYAQVIRRLIDV